MAHSFSLRWDENTRWIGRWRCSLDHSLTYFAQGLRVAFVQQRWNTLSFVRERVQNIEYLFPFPEKNK